MSAWHPVPHVVVTTDATKSRVLLGCFWQPNLRPVRVWLLSFWMWSFVSTKGKVQCVGFKVLLSFVWLLSRLPWLRLSQTHNNQMYACGRPLDGAFDSLGLNGWGLLACRELAGKPVSLTAIARTILVTSAAQTVDATRRRGKDKWKAAKVGGVVDGSLCLCRICGASCSTSADCGGNCQVCAQNTNFPFTNICQPSGQNGTCLFECSGQSSQRSCLMRRFGAWFHHAFCVMFCSG
jgi:hypothetical protein